jgi:hypothetical protein
MHNIRARIWKASSNNILISIVSDLFRLREVPFSLPERISSGVTEFMVLSIPPVKYSFIWGRWFHHNSKAVLPNSIEYSNS